MVKLPACERCRTRKTKCDTQLPSCVRCAKAGVSCINVDKVMGTAVKRSYLYERRNETGNKRSRTSSPTPSPFYSPIDTVLSTSLNSGPAISEDLDIQIRQLNSSQKSDREIFIDKENAAVSKLGKDFLKQGRKNYTRDRITDISAYDDEMLTRLTKRYFTWTNSAYPVLHECMLHLQLKRCQENSASDVDMYQVKMAIAISLASISRPHVSTSEIGRMAHLFWKSATKSHTNILQGYGIERLQNILLLLQYTLLVPRAGNLWQLSGTAMRFATEMGLYTEPNPSQRFDPLTLDLRRRIFWTCYCIDRVLATVMGRPTSIADTWISTKLPQLVDDMHITVKGIAPGPLCHLKFAQIQNIRICRLQSEIHKSLYGPLCKLSLQELVIWTWQMYDQLRLWRRTYTHSTPCITKEWTELQFHIAVVLLFRPSPNRSTLSKEAVHVAFHSAGEVMRLVKVMHRDLSALFSWLTVQNLFMCGLTFVSSLKNLSQELCSSFYEIILQIQSCTAMLETLSALEAGASESIRNAFETISSSVLQTIASPSLPQHPKDCIWARIAKSDDDTILRPLQVEGVKVTIKSESYVLGEIGLNHDHKHFSSHDIDASTINEVADLPLHSELYAIREPEYVSAPANETPGPGMDVFDPAESMEWPELNLGAEFERWFLHPFPEEL